jgi:hypothetical protein
VRCSANLTTVYSAEYEIRLKGVQKTEEIWDYGSECFDLCFWTTAGRILF